MRTALKWLSFVSFTILLSSCSKKLYIDRTQFIKDGDTIPTIDLSQYKSVEERSNQDTTLSVAMAISGGGSRASNFAMGIMLGLENVKLVDGQNALAQVDYLSTVSGGGFAGGAYISALFDHHFESPDQPFSLKHYVNKYIKEDLSVSYVGALVRGYFHPKAWVSFVDYGDALEKSINDNVLGYKRRKKTDHPRNILLGDMFVPKSQPQIPVLYPMHITNSSAMGTLAIFPFTPDVLEKYGIIGYTHSMKLFENPNLNTFEVPLAVGIKASGSFPVLIPNTTLHSRLNEKRKFLHIMDGAMTDNQGYYTALEVLKQTRTPKKVLLVVDADASGNLYTFSSHQGSKSPAGVFLSLSTSGLYARRATMKKDLSEIGEKFGITPIFLGFNALVENLPIPDNLPKRIIIKAEQERLIKILESDSPQLSDIDQQILYELLVNIGTKYTIKPNEQKLLFLAGQKIVAILSDRIKAAMND